MHFLELPPVNTVKFGRLLISTYFRRSSFSREFYNTSSFLAAVKEKTEKSAFTNPTFLVFKIRIPLGAMCCENFGRFHRRKSKKITNKVIKTAKNTLIWAFII